MQITFGDYAVTRTGNILRFDGPHYQVVGNIHNLGNGAFVELVRLMTNIYLSDTIAEDAANAMAETAIASA